MPEAKYPVKSLGKALKILDLLARNSEGMSIVSLNQELRMGKSTIHRLLATLRDHNLVLVEPLTSNYSLGPKVLQWSDALTRQNLLLRLGPQIMRKLGDECQETVNLGILQGTEVAYLATRESKKDLRMGTDMNAQHPAHCTALGKILLSTLPEAEFRKLYEGSARLAALTPNTITDPSVLWEHVERARQEGIAYDLEENVEGGVCIAALIRNYSGHGVAALSISMPKQRLSGERLLKFKDYLQRACAEFSTQLGYSKDGKVSAERKSQGKARRRGAQSELVGT